MKKYLILTLIAFFLSCGSLYAQPPMFSSGGGGGAPTDAHYLVDLANGTLTAEVVVSANGKSLVTAADYAAMKALTGWYDATSDLDADLQTLAESTAWRLFYSNGTSVITELALGTSGQYLKANGITSAPTWDTPGDVVGPGTHSADYVPQWNATPNSKTLVEGFAITAAGKALMDDAAASNQRTTLGVPATTEVPLDSDFGSNGLMERTGAGTYDTATAADILGFIDANVDGTEYGYLNGVTSAIQSQLDARCLESVFGISLGSGMSLDGTALKASTKDVDENIWQSIAVDASIFIVDGTNVTTPAEQTLNSGPKTYVADNANDAAGTFEFKIPNMPENWDGGSIIIELKLISDEATPTGTIEWDMSIQARGNDELVNNTWITTNGEIYFEDAETANTTIDTQWKIFHCKNKTAMAAEGTGGDSLFVKGTRDNDDATHDTSTQGIWILGAMAYYQIDDLDEKD